MNIKPVILGNGFIGQRLGKELSCPISTRPISSFEDVESVIEEHRSNVLINCIGFVGKNSVDECEGNRSKTLFANTYIPILLAEVAFRYNVKLVHLSSGCIYHYDYGNDSPISETEIPNFFNLYYSRTKIYSEAMLKTLNNFANILILRIRIPLDDRPHQKNLLTKLIKYQKVLNIANSITYIPDFIKAVKHLLAINATGVFNTVNDGALQYSRLLDIYKHYVTDFNYSIIDYKTLGLVRTNLILSVNKLKASGFSIRNIDNVCEECVTNYLEYEKCLAQAGA